MPRDQTALVVDDDEGLAQIVALILRAEGFDVQTANNGLDGCSAYFRNPTDWVVSDIQMPQLDGLEMMQRIRSRNPGVKTIYMSGEVEKFHLALQQEARQFGVKILPKPFTRDRLIEQMAGASTAHSHSL